MRISIEAINHVALVVRDIAAATNFYVEMLGLRRHHAHSSWLVLNDTSTLHLIEIPEAEVDKSLYHQVQHFALQVPDLRGVLKVLLEHAQRPFQMDFEGNEHPVSSRTDPLDFGIGTLFTYDPDGNLVEFLQMGYGLYSLDVQPR